MGRNRPRFDDWDESYYDDRRQKEFQRDRRKMKRMRNSLKSKDIDSLYDDE